MTDIDNKEEEYDPTLADRLLHSKYAFIEEKERDFENAQVMKRELSKFINSKGIESLFSETKEIESMDDEESKMRKEEDEAKIKFYFDTSDIPKSYADEHEGYSVIKELKERIEQGKFNAHERLDTTPESADLCELNLPGNKFTKELMDGLKEAVEKKGESALFSGTKSIDVNEFAVLGIVPRMICNHDESETGEVPRSITVFNKEGKHDAKYIRVDDFPKEVEYILKYFIDKFEGNEGFPQIDQELDLLDSLSDLTHEIKKIRRKRRHIRVLKSIPVFNLNSEMNKRDSRRDH